MYFTEGWTRWVLWVSLNRLPTCMTEHRVGDVKRICSDFIVKQRMIVKERISADMRKNCSVSHRFFSVSPDGIVTVRYQQEEKAHIRAKCVGEKNRHENRE